MTWEFKVGQKVVCAENFKTPVMGDEVSPVLGGIYTISNIFSHPDGLALQFVEARRSTNAMRQWNGVAGYLSKRFRPLVTDTQSWLKEILETPPPVKVPEYVEIGDGWGVR